MTSFLLIYLLGYIISFSILISIAIRTTESKTLQSGDLLVSAITSILSWVVVLFFVTKSVVQFVKSLKSNKRLH